MHKHIVLCVEGETEIEFYKKLIDYFKQKNNSINFQIKISYINADGIGGFKKEILRKFKKQIKIQCKKCQPIIVLCYDTDVFEDDFSSKPNFNIENIEKDFLKQKVKQVIKIGANKSIEDWFLIDWQGILKFLKLDKNTKIQGKNGSEKIKALYRKANKFYIKGHKSKNLIENLNIELIYEKIKKNVEELEILKNFFIH